LVIPLIAWAGAAVFVLSLAYFVFSYAVTFGSPASAGNTSLAVIVNVALFSVFAFHHSLFARAGLRAWAATVFAPEMERSAYVWVASMLFFAVCGFWQPVAGVAWAAAGAMRWVLMIAQAFGIWLTLRSAWILDFRELAGIPRRDSASPPIEFTDTGPYGWVRHPIYTGWFLFLWSASPMTNTRLVFAVVSCAYLLLAMPWEERSLRTSSGGAYERYAQRVRWKLVPGVY
jgi:protein-S-isoprenylcysteine O-methyltransferase Ste14